MNKPDQKHVLAVYALATDDQIEAGKAWYQDANDLARELDPNDHNRAAGVIAAVSPLTPWHRNKDLARQTYRDQGLHYGTLSRNRDKANRIFAGEDPLSVLTGEKVRAFYAAIADPDHADVVCVDRHAYDIATGSRSKDGTRPDLRRRGLYKIISDVYVASAKIIGISAVALQATTWITWRDQQLRGTKYEWILER